MASQPVKETSAGPSKETVEQRFRFLADTWERDVAYLSSAAARLNHPAYREIVKLGKDVIPLMLRDMEDKHTHWFFALEEITGADPVPESDAGNIPKIVQAWLGWAKEHGYRW